MKWLPGNRGTLAEKIELKRKLAAARSTPVSQS